MGGEQVMFGIPCHTLLKNFLLVVIILSVFDSLLIL